MRISIPTLFWNRLRKLGVEQASVLRHASLPPTLIPDDKIRVTETQFFSIWEAIELLSTDPAVGLKLGSQFQSTGLPASMLAAHYARDYHDALKRYARYLQLGVSSEIRITERGEECSVEWRWVHAVKPEPSLLTDITHAILVEIGRRGTEQPFNPKRVELKRTPERTGVHRDYFNCPVKFRMPRNALIFHSADLRRPFVTYNAELLEMLQPQLDRTDDRARAGSSMSEQVKRVLRRMLPGGRPETSAVAHELGLSVRTLQRRIVDEGRTFRELLSEVRKDLAAEYLNRPGVELNEVALLLGYGDTSSFYRAFRSWEGTTPATKRADFNRRLTGRSKRLQAHS